MLHKPKEKHQSLDSKNKKKKRITFQVDAPKITKRLFSLSRTKKINSKAFNQKRKELGIYRIKFTPPILRSVQYDVYELFVKAFHAT